MCLAVFLAPLRESVLQNQIRPMPWAIIVILNPGPDPLRHGRVIIVRLFWRFNHSETLRSKFRLLFSRSYGGIVYIIHQRVAIVQKSLSLWLLLVHLATLRTRRHQETHWSEAIILLTSFAIFLLRVRSRVLLCHWEANLILFTLRDYGVFLNEIVNWDKLWQFAFGQILWIFTYDFAHHWEFSLIIAVTIFFRTFFLYDELIEIVDDGTCFVVCPTWVNIKISRLL